MNTRMQVCNARRQIQNKLDIQAHQGQSAILQLTLYDDSRVTKRKQRKNNNNTTRIRSLLWKICPG